MLRHARDAVFFDTVYVVEKTDERHGNRRGYREAQRHETQSGYNLSGVKGAKRNGLCQGEEDWQNSHVQPDACGQGGAAHRETKVLLNVYGRVQYQIVFLQNRRQCEDKQYCQPHRGNHFPRGMFVRFRQQVGSADVNKFASEHGQYQREQRLVDANKVCEQNSYDRRRGIKD